MEAVRIGVKVWVGVIVEESVTVKEAVEVAVFVAL